MTVSSERSMNFNFNLNPFNILLKATSVNLLGGTKGKSQRMTEVTSTHPVSNMSLCIKYIINLCINI